MRRRRRLRLADALAVFSVPTAGTWYVRVSPDPSVSGATPFGAYKLGVDLFSDPSAIHSAGRPLGGALFNGGFETGDFSGWTTQFNSCGGAGDWYVYSGTSTPLNGFGVPAPTEGAFAAVADQTGPSTQILYQDVTLAAGMRHILTFSLYYNNQAGLFATPATLDCATVPNQQFRIDLINTAAPLTSVDPGDVLLSAYASQVGDPLILGPTTYTVDISALAGQTVRLRIANADTEFYFTTIVDAMDIISFPQGVDLQVAKSGPDSAATGSNVPYSIVVVNNSQTARTNVTMTDVTPPDTTFVSLTSPAGWTCTTPPVGGTGTVTCSIPSLPAGALAIFQLVLAVDCVPASPPNRPTGALAEVDNTAMATSTEPDGDMGDNTSTAVTVVFDPPPTLTCPESVTVPGNVATDCVITGATANLESYASATDNCPGVTIACDPPSGTVLPIGSSTVTCTATDISQGTSTCSFTVNVVQPAMVCFVDDYTGDTFTETVDVGTGAARGFWTYTVAATGTTYCAQSNRFAYTPGHSLVSGTTDDPLYAMSANFILTPNGSGTVQFIIRPSERHVLRDRNIGNDPPCTTPK